MYASNFVSSYPTPIESCAYSIYWLSVEQFCLRKAHGPSGSVWVMNGWQFAVMAFEMLFNCIYNSPLLHFICWPTQDETNAQNLRRLICLLIISMRHTLSP